jgi:hypothetical protein
MHYALLTRRTICAGRTGVALRRVKRAEASPLCSSVADAVPVVVADKLIWISPAVKGAMAVTLLYGRPTLPTAPTPLAAGKGLGSICEAHARERSSEHAKARPLDRLAPRDVVLCQSRG